MAVPLQQPLEVQSHDTGHGELAAQGHPLQPSLRLLLQQRCAGAGVRAASVVRPWPTPRDGHPTPAPGKARKWELPREPGGGGFRSLPESLLRNPGVRALTALTCWQLSVAQ